ncbi:heterokaryon incompatibility [Trichoderma arundinaceum]|uniref:Heterokaryon incompatibility n=1 Tax=Trichoderma arundinaceum TaxID=490622 RepID=A0A395NPE9_TRIAR|nr:heterokaryon incompatibility [Trichoderma arundinaceum]
MVEQTLYSSLPLKEGEIRVLTVLPDEWAADIHCELGVVSLNNNPEYVALSYVWGPPFQDGTLYIGGQEQRIGRGLETALRYYRRAGWSMPLWVDAVCINQGDIPERSSQVSIMDRIYSSAATVFVLLGAGIDLAAGDYFQKVKALKDVRFSTYGQKYFEATLLPKWEKSNARAISDDKETSVLFTFLERAISLKINDHLDQVPRWGAVSHETEESQYPWESLLQTFENFTREVWWTRVWTLQESVVGFAPIFIYRTAAAPWAMITEAASSIGAHITDCCGPYLANKAPSRYSSAVKRLLAHTTNIEKTRQVYRETRLGTRFDQLILTTIFPKMDFLDPVAVGITGSLDSNLLYKYLCMHNRREATDARDKIYALLSLTKLGKKRSFIYPDYDRTLKDVYITTSRALIRESGSLDLLSAAGRFRNDSFPSWVPDWSIMNESDEDATQMSALLMYDATYGTEASASFHKNDNSLLELEGVFFDQVATLGQRPTSEGTSGGDIWQTIFQWMQIAQEHSANTTWIEFCRTICAGLLIWPQDQVFRRMGFLTREIIQTLIPWRDPISGEFTQHIPSGELVQQSVDQMKIYFSVWFTILGRQAEQGMGSAPPSPTMEDFLKITTNHKRFAVSSLGQIGLVPSSAENSDYIVFFKGCRFPCVARPVARSNDEKYFKIIGDCYIDGFMDGQIKNRMASEENSHNVDWETITLC